MFVTAEGRRIPYDVPFTLKGVKYSATWMRHVNLAEKQVVGLVEVPDPAPVQAVSQAPDQPAPVEVPVEVPVDMATASASIEIPFDMGTTSAAIL